MLDRSTLQRHANRPRRFQFNQAFQKNQMGKILPLVILSLAHTQHALDTADSDCMSLCTLVGGCGTISTACHSGSCLNIFKYREGICLETGDGSCARSEPLSCADAARLNPTRACTRIMPDSYCKLNSSVNKRVCHGIGAGIGGLPCRIGIRGCDGSQPYSCDAAIVHTYTPV